MAEQPIQITQGLGTQIDMVAPGNASILRQVVALGDPNATLAAGIANVTNGQLSVGATLYGPITTSFTNSSITAFQGASPWFVNASIVGIPGVNASIQGTVPVSGSLGLATGATLTAYQGGAPWLTNASIIGTPNVAFAAGATVTANQGTSPWVVQPAANSTMTVYQGNAPWLSNVSVIGTVPVSGNVGLIANATLTAFQGSAPWLANVSVVGIPSVTATLVGAVTLAAVNLSPLTGGWTPYATASLGSLATISANTGKFGGYFLTNLNAAPAYLQVFDTTGNVTLGFTTPNLILPIPANATPANGIGANLEIANGSVIANGIKTAVTTGPLNASIVATPLVGTVWYH